MLTPLRRSLRHNRWVAVLAFVLVCVHILQLHVHADVDHAEAQFHLSSVVPADHDESEEFDIVAEGLLKHIDSLLPTILLLCVVLVAAAARLARWLPSQQTAPSQSPSSLRPPLRAPPR